MNILSINSSRSAIVTNFGGVYVAGKLLQNEPWGLGWGIGGMGGGIAGGDWGGMKYPVATWARSVWKYLKKNCFLTLYTWNGFPTNANFAQCRFRQ